MDILTKARQKAAPTEPEHLTNKEYVDGRIMAHGHTIGQVDGLQEALDSKPAAIHTHAMTDVTNLVTTLNAKANLDSPAFSGVPTVPTAPVASTAQIANTAYVEQRANDHAYVQAVNHCNALRNEMYSLIGSGGGAMIPTAATWLDFKQLPKVPNGSNPSWAEFFLPSGGTWAYYTEGRGCGVGAGGTSLGSFNSSGSFVGFAWRIA